MPRLRSWPSGPSNVERARGQPTLATCRAGSLCSPGALPRFGAATAGRAAAERPVRLEIWDLRRARRSINCPTASSTTPAAPMAAPPSTAASGCGDFRRCRPEAKRAARSLFPLRRRARILGQGQQPAAADGAILRHQDLRLPDHRVGADRRRRRACAASAWSATRGSSSTTATRPICCAISSTARFGREGWACDKLAPEDGETPVDGIFVKERCRKEIDERTTASLATRHLPRPGKARSIRAPAARPRAVRELSAVRAGAGSRARGLATSSLFNARVSGTQ